MITVTKKDLIELGYGTSFAADIIRESKKLMIAKGHTYYQSRKLDRVPKEAVEELLAKNIINIEEIEPFKPLLEKLKDETFVKYLDEVL